MDFIQSGANQLISQFGEEVTIYSMDNEVPDDADDPMFIDSSGSEESSSTHSVRLYTSPSEEMMMDYGFEQETEAIMYSTEDIASIGDEVEYSPRNLRWVVDNVATNQIGSGPYIFVYSMVGL